jgi:hypothetical protein
MELCPSTKVRNSSSVAVTSFGPAPRSLAYTPLNDLSNAKNSRAVRNSSLNSYLAIFGILYCQRG